MPKDTGIEYYPEMMEHYLSKSGKPLEVDASIFNTNDEVLKVTKPFIAYAEWTEKISSASAQP